MYIEVVPLPGVDSYAVTLSILPHFTLHITPEAVRSSFGSDIPIIVI